MSTKRKASDAANDRGSFDLSRLATADAVEHTIITFVHGDEKLNLRIILEGRR